ncbi:MAG TPA: hypothetical protein VGL83_08120 [Stellaceae bacterium]|jgi:hypothetical protein
MDSDSSNGAADTNSGPSLGDIIAGQAGGALDELSQQIQSQAYGAGSSAAQGFVDALSPYAPYALIAIGVIVIALAFGGR